jgi:hypothetical protein
LEVSKFEEEETVFEAILEMTGFGILRGVEGISFSTTFS